MEIVYLLGVAYLYANDASRAAIEFATVYEQDKMLAPRSPGTIINDLRSNQTRIATKL